MVALKMTARAVGVALLAATFVVAGSACRPYDAGTGRRLKTDGPFRVTQYELPFRGCTKPQKIGTGIYAAVGGEEGRRGAIVRYDTTNGTLKTVVRTAVGQEVHSFAVDTRWLVFSVELDLFARDLLTGRQWRLAHGRDLYSPALSGDFVSWDDLAEDRSHMIVVRNLASRESTVVAYLKVADLYNNFPSWDGNRLVWTDVVGGKGVYGVYDVGRRASQEFSLAEGEFRYPGYAQLTRDRIYSINFDRVDEWDWSAQRVGYFSTRERRFTPVVPEHTIVNSLAAADGLVAIVDHLQRLMVIPATGHGTPPKYRPIPGRVDFVQSSAGGSIIAWREYLDSNRCILWVIEPK